MNVSFKSLSSNTTFVFAVASYASVSSVVVVVVRVVVADGDEWA